MDSQRDAIIAILSCSALGLVMGLTDSFSSSFLKRRFGELVASRFTFFANVLYIMLFVTIYIVGSINGF